MWFYKAKIKQREKSNGSNNNLQQPSLQILKKKLGKAEFIKTSTVRKKYYNDSFPTLTEYLNDKTTSNTQIKELTKKVLSVKPSGDASNKDTLLHILNGVATKNGKKCLFFDSSKNINLNSKYTQNSYLNMIDANDDNSAKFVLSLTSLTGLQDDDDKDDDNKDINGIDDNKSDNNDKLMILKESIKNNTFNPIIDKIRKKLGCAHNVSPDRIVITDIYSNGVGCPYYVKDLTQNEKNRIINQTVGFSQKMKSLFDSYNKFSIHPALLHDTYDISMFDVLGNKTFSSSDTGKFKVGPKGKEREYIQPTNWTRYGLKVLGKYSDDKWLKPFQDPLNWYRAYHGTSREAGSSIFKTQFRSGAHNAYGKGIYCTPDINIAASYCSSRGGTIKIETIKGTKTFYFVFQVAVNPSTMNNPALIPNFDPNCEKVKYWIAPTGADIRPYGILIKEV